MYNNLSFDNLKIILTFLDFETIKNIINTSKKMRKMIYYIPKINILYFINDNLLKLIGEKCIYQNIWGKSNKVIIEIIDQKININFKYLYRNKLQNDIFTQKNSKGNLFKCISQSYLFMNNEYNLFNLDEITEYNFKNICRGIKKVKIHYFTNGFDDQEYLNDIISI